jgi:hypothetical protein
MVKRYRKIHKNTKNKYNIDKKTWNNVINMKKIG